jgi:hypothetical protein
MNEIATLFSGAAVFGAVAAAAVTALVFLVTIFIVQLQKREKYNREQHHAVLSLIRANYEDRLSEINARLMSSEERWKDVNHLLLDNQRHQPDAAPEPSDSRVSSNRFLRQYGIDAKDASVDPTLVFVLTPFNEKERRTFAIIQDVVTRIGFRCVRGDEEYIAGEILPHVVDLITRARLVIANISGRNPNVYYELGIAHALGKPTVLVSRTLDSVPFDLRAKYIVLFDSGEELRGGLRDSLSRILADPELSV